MSAPQEHDDDLNPTATSGYKVTAKKTVDEYANLDANDESLARWKASLGIGAGGGGEAKFIIKTLFLTSPTLPAGKTITLDLTDPQALAKVKKEPIVIKQGVEYSVGVRFIIENDVISGLRYLHAVKCLGITVDKVDHMIGSFGPKAEEQSAIFLTEESPSGWAARSRTYHVKSRITDDDGHTHAEFEWTFKLAEEW